MGSDKKFSFDYQIVCQLYSKKSRSAFIYQDYNLYNLYKYQVLLLTKYKQYALYNTLKLQLKAYKVMFLK